MTAETRSVRAKNVRLTAPALIGRETAGAGGGEEITDSAGVLAAISDETGSGLLVFNTSPTLVTPALGTPASGVATNLTGTAASLTAGAVTTNASLTGHVTSVGNSAILGSFTLAQLNTAISDGTAGGGTAMAAVISSADAALVGTVNQLDVVDISGFSANRIWSLPTTAAVDDLCGIHLSTGDDTYSMNIRTTASSNDTIEGVDHDAADYTSVYTTGERMVFRCTIANTAWIVEEDGRIPSSAVVYKAADITANSAATWTKVNVDTAARNVGDIADITTGYDITLRRSGTYIVTGSCRARVATANGYNMRVYDGTTYQAWSLMTPGASTNVLATNSRGKYLPKGTALDLWFYSVDVNAGCVGGELKAMMSCSEVL